MRNKNKLIMFDFGGVTEIRSYPHHPVYNWKTIYVDGIRYSIGKTAYGDMEKSDMSLLDMFINSDVNDSLFRGCSNFDETHEVLGPWLSQVACEPNMSTYYAVRKFVDYVRARYVFCPYNDKVVDVQRWLKEHCLVGGMTNNNWIWSPRFHQVTDPIGYDIVWESWKSGCIKPEPMAFKMVESDCGLTGEQILLFDDSKANVRAAIDNGWCACQIVPGDVRSQIESVAMEFLNDDPDTMEFLRTYHD